MPGGVEFADFAQRFTWPLTGRISGPTTDSVAISLRENPLEPKEKLFRAKIGDKGEIIANVQRQQGDRGFEKGTLTLQFKDQKIEVIFEDAQESVTPGQSAVLYDNNALLGGGIIKQAIR